jgi:hypothetical protein
LSSLRLMARQEGNSMTRFQLVIAGLTTEGSLETGFLAGYGDGGHRACISCRPSARASGSTFYRVSCSSRERSHGRSQATPSSASPLT